MQDAAVDEPFVTLAAGRGSQVRLTLSNPDRPWSDDFVDYQVLVQGDGLSAETKVTSLAGDSLGQFLTDLAEEYRGWSGTRQWRSLEDQMRIQATWSSRGHVTLSVRLRPRAYDPPWDILVDFDVEAGAEMQSLAVEVSNLFNATA
jgi:hypothetical protein